MERSIFHHLALLFIATQSKDRLDMKPYTPLKTIIQCYALAPNRPIRALQNQAPAAPNALSLSITTLQSPGRVIACNCICSINRHHHI